MQFSKSGQIPYELASCESPRGAASAGLRRRRFPTSFVTTPGACWPRNTTVLSRHITATLPCSSARRSGRPICSTACASVVEAPRTALYCRPLGASRATPRRASPPHARADAAAAGAPASPVRGAQGVRCGENRLLWARRAAEACGGDARRGVARDAPSGLQ